MELETEHNIREPTHSLLRHNSSLIAEGWGGFLPLLSIAKLTPCRPRAPRLRYRPRPMYSPFTVLSWSRALRQAEDGELHSSSGPYRNTRIKSHFIIRTRAFSLRQTRHVYTPYEYTIPSATIHSLRSPYFSNRLSHIKYTIMLINTIRNKIQELIFNYLVVTYKLIKAGTIYYPTSRESVF